MIAPHGPSGVAPIPITYVIDVLQTSKAGTEGHLLRLMRDLDRSRFDPDLVVLQPSRLTDEMPNCTVLGFRSIARLSDWPCLGKLVRHFQSRRTQIVELHFSDSHFVGTLAARRAGVPVVISCRRDLGHQYTARSLSLLRLANPWVTRFLANSHQVVETLSRREGASPQRFDVISNGVDIESFDHTLHATAPPRFLEFAAGKRIVALLANLRPVKNVAGFLQAAHWIAQAIPDAGFVIMGDGTEAAPLHRLAEELQLQSRICWLGSTENPGTFLQHAHLGCLTSRAEGFSNAIIEYMAASLPVIATRVGGASEAIVEGVTGHIVSADDMRNLADRAISLLQDETRRITMGEAGRQRVLDNFTHEIQIAKYQAYYERLWREYAQ